MRLKEYRKSLGLTQEQAGAKMGITKQGYRSLEVNWPDLRTDSLLALVKHLGAPIIIDVAGGVRFASQAEQDRLSKPTTQDQLIDDQEHVPDDIDN